MAATQPAQGAFSDTASAPDSNEPPSFFVRALYDFESSDTSSLSFRKGAIIEVLTQLESGWWDGLMDNDVRGWFPSNYVEPISDEEAEVELAAQATLQNQLAIAGSPATSATNAFTGLSLGGGFDSLQALIKGEGLGASDAFEQLAEAAMLDPRRGVFGLGEVANDNDNGNNVANAGAGASSQRLARNGGAAPPLHVDVRHSMASASSFSTTEVSPRFDSPVRSESTSLQSRSQSNSISESDRYKDYPITASAAERERLRAQSLSVTEPRIGGGYSSPFTPSALGRPRAATGLQSVQADMLGGGGSYGSPYRTQQPPQQQAKAEDDFWIPKVTERGEIVYYNTRTKAMSYEMPSGYGLIVNGTARSSNRSSMEDSDTTRPPSSAMMRPAASWQGSSSHSKRSLASSMSSRPTSSNATGNSRPSSTHSNTTAVLMGSSSRSSRPTIRNAVDNMPDPRDVPPPWKLRLTDDERQFFFYNKLTREIRYEAPPDLVKRPVGSRASSSFGLHNETHENGADRRSSSYALGPSLSGDSDDSDLDGVLSPKLPGKSPRGRIGGGPSAAKDDDQFGLSSLAGHPILTSTPVAPMSLIEDSRAASETQKKLAPAQPVHVAMLVRRAHEAIRAMAAIACEQIGTDGLSEVDRAGPIVSRDGIYLPRLATATAAVVAAIRDVLYAAGSLALLPPDAHALSTLVVMLTERSLVNRRASSGGGDSSGLAEFNSAIRALRSKSQSDAKLLKLAGASSADVASPIPSNMYPFGRKINATISKLVLSARQVIDHTVTLSSSPTSRRESTMNELDAETFEKIYQCRQRLREDALELNRMLQSFGDEAERARSSALVASHGRGWLRRIEGSLESGTGSNGVGPSTLGGGMGAGWRGSGFVLPTAYEVAALRIEAQGKFNNPFELKRDVHHALVRGRATLIRKPSTPLSAALMSGLEAQQSALKAEVELLLAALTPAASVPSSLSSAALAASPTTLEQRDAKEPPLSCRVEGVLLRCGTLLALVEDVDVASSVDVDGLGASEAQPKSAINERIASNASKARMLVQRLCLLKQATYDASSRLVFSVQELESIPLLSGPASLTSADAAAATERDNERRRAQASKAMEVLPRLSAALVKTLADLAAIAEEQLKDAAPHIGARALVYEADDEASALSPSASSFNRQSIAISNGLGEEYDASPYNGKAGSIPTTMVTSGDTDGSENEVMYLGPGIAVPNGPRTRNRSVASTVQSSSSNLVSPVQQSSHNATPASSLPPSVRGGALGSIVSRQRSTSVTTGGSSRSMQSLQETTKSLLSRRGTLADSHHPSSIDEGDESRSSSSRLRKAHGGGDDAPTSAHSFQESEAGSLNGSLRRREEEVPWYLEPDYDDNDLVMGTDGQVKGATLAALLARVTMHNAFDTNFNNTFLMTYRSFTTTEELLELLFARYRIMAPAELTEDEYAIWIEKKQKPIRLRVFNLLKSWLEGYFYEGEDDRYLERVRRFALEEMSQTPSMKAPSHQLVRLVERRQGEGEQMIRKMVLPTSAPPPILPRNLKKLKLLEIDPLEMARQLTLIESRLYNQVKPAECLGLKWTKPDNEIYAKGIMESINTHNKISAWVAEAILRQEDLKKRAALIKHFIAVADRCRALNNFSGMWAIVSALSTAPIHRLRRTWDVVSQKHVAVFESLETLMSASRNWANYREMIHKLNPPCVPFLGRYLGDLTFIEDGNRDRLKDDNRLINFGKRQKTAEVIREITIHQSTPYNLTPVPAIQKFIGENLIESKGADELYEQSLMLEPREREDEKIARLLQESGFL
ncbi:cell division cycle-related protein [Thecaphora frezii]